MKPLILSILVLLSQILSAGAQEWALDGYDPLGYASGRAVPGRSDIATMWKGKLWHFASEENRSRFEADPRAYAPGFGGLCPVALSRGERVAGDPQHFVIIGNRLYLLRSDAAEREMMQDPRKILMEARKVWAGSR
ncbi:YHS domain-containing (seleno)protein [Paracoccus sp. (in: a-proteobacteria)]|uniref:YHS domain-containing (seleno)protein n=1 Tax=Paracoccus sp. TaxID=267 RepID=UPI003A872A1F